MCCHHWRGRHTSVAMSVCRGVENIQLTASVPPVLTEDVLCEKGLVLLDHLGWVLYFCSGAVTYYTPQQSRRTFYHH